MNIYGKEPQEQAIQRLIHDTSGRLCLQSAWSRRIEGWLEENANALTNAGINSDIVKKSLTYITSQTRQLEEDVDFYVGRAKNDFK